MPSLPVIGPQIKEKQKGGGGTKTGLNWTSVGWPVKEAIGVGGTPVGWPIARLKYFKFCSNCMVHCSENNKSHCLIGQAKIIIKCFLLNSKMMHK